MSINNSHWQSSGVIFFVQILYSYFKYTRRLFLGSALFVSGCNFYQSFMRNKEGIKVELQKKAHRGIFVRNITFLTACPPFYFSFCCFLRLLPCPSDILTEWPWLRYIILLWVVFCVMPKLWKSLAISYQLVSISKNVSLASVLLAMILH